MGLVAAIHVSDGGVPKRPVGAATIGPRGLSGDRQATPKLHGRPWQAVCLWSAEVIDGLRAEGHPIFPGAAGENLTVRGIDWSSVVPGTHLAVGDSVVLEVTAYAVPCKKNAAWFLGGDFTRMGQDRHPGSSRVYAGVVSTGEVRPGDEVTVAGATDGAPWTVDELNRRWPA
jgi:MOSC domain-containing protein YiiM